MSRSVARAATALALGVSVLGAGTALAAPKPVALGPNLAPNASFEQSTVDQATLHDVPVNPVGWTWEGATVLFDYNQRGGHTGKRNIQISGALGGGRQLCDHSATGAEMCAANPAYGQTHQVDESLAPSYSIRPFWVTQAPIPVKAGATYRFSVFALRPSLAPDAGVMGEGAATQVRWVDAAGKTVKITAGAQLVKGPKRQLGFKLISADLKAPAGATGAVLMLGHTDYSHTGAAVAFDDVAFQKVG
jgi:hypothetical protein